LLIQFDGAYLTALGVDGICSICYPCYVPDETFDLAYEPKVRFDFDPMLNLSNYFRMLYQDL